MNNARSLFMSNRHESILLYIGRKKEGKIIDEIKLIFITIIYDLINAWEEEKGRTNAREPLIKMNAYHLVFVLIKQIIISPYVFYLLACLRLLVRTEGLFNAKNCLE